MMYNNIKKLESVNFVLFGLFMIFLTFIFPIFVINDISINPKLFTYTGTKLLTHTEVTLLMIFTFSIYVLRDRKCFGLFKGLERIPLIYRHFFASCMIISVFIYLICKFLFNLSLD